MQAQNQSSEFKNINYFTSNQPLQELYKAYGGKDAASLTALGEQAGNEKFITHARLANAHPPRLKTFDSKGNRLDEVEFHPSYHALMSLSMEHSLHYAPNSHLHRATGFMMMTQCDPAHLCPISMTYAVLPALKANIKLYKLLEKPLSSISYDENLKYFINKKSLTLGMGMTEKQGGSDVRANQTTAHFEGQDHLGQRYSITGHKWFMSAPMCDAFLVLAQTQSGISCFFVPRITENGKNSLMFQRLKDKLGNKANASSEVEFQNATGWLVGEEGRGIPTILDMATMTRLDCALGTTGLMRQALNLALHHTHEREAFGKPIKDHPLMQNVLADLCLEYEASLALVMRLAHAFDEKDTAFTRLITPLAKYYICKRGAAFAQEAMECLGGNGYVEAEGEGDMARIYREMPLNSIWEGAGNIMALDMLRALKNPVCIENLNQELNKSRGKNSYLDKAIARLPHLLEEVREAEARFVAQEITLTLQAALLVRCAPDYIYNAFCVSRLGGEWGLSYGTLKENIYFEDIIARNYRTNHS
jgi:putative acyl-CoA dehydrogenase